MKYLVFTLLVLMGFGCRSYPRRDLSTPEGIIAGYFNRKPSEVEKIKDQGLTREEIVGVLIISSATDLTQREILSKMLEESLENISEEAGLDAGTYKRLKENALREIARY